MQVYYFIGNKTLPNERDTLCLIKVPDWDFEKATVIAFDSAEVGKIYFEKSKLPDTCYLIHEKDLTSEHLHDYKGYLFVFHSEEEMNELYANVHNYDYKKHIIEHKIEMDSQVYPVERLH